MFFFEKIAKMLAFFKKMRYNSIVVGQKGAKCIKVVIFKPQNRKKGEFGMELVGEYHHTLDAKNRLFIPAKMRDEIGPDFYVTRKITNSCLALYPPEKWRELSDKLNSNSDSRYAQLKRFIFSKTVSVTPDSHGRIILPAELLSYAKIDKNAVIVGFGNSAEIWSEALYAAEELAIDPATLLELGNELGL